MPEHNIKILCTRPVNASLIEEARKRNITLDIVPFIETEPLQTIEVQQEVEQAAIQVATVVFTSMNAVEAVTNMLDSHVPEWRIYSMGYKTKQLIEAYFGAGTVTGSSDNASALADLIIENNDTDEVIFFCGNRRRDELSKKLEEQDIMVNEIVVYQTKNIEHEVKKEYNAVLFFSPSAAESFFKKNKLTANCIVFAIGTTTQKTIQQYCKNKIIVSRQPGKDMLVEEALQYKDYH
jgi:uroporphyrinogen-III synthase